MAAQSTRKTSPSTPGAGRFRRTPLRPSTGRYQRFLEKVFEQADVDKDGRMTFTETYEWVLRLYVQINRHAPINPPSWAQVQRVVDVMDTDHSRFIAPEEFRALAEIFVRRAAARVVANKIVTLLVAPLLAEVLLRWFQRQDWLYDMVLVPFVPALAWPILTNPILGRTILMAILVSTLGGFVMGQLNNFLDHQIDRREAKALEREVAAAKSTC
jgi:hypothetical protein